MSLNVYILFAFQMKRNELNKKPAAISMKQNKEERKNKNKIKIKRKHNKYLNKI